LFLRSQPTAPQTTIDSIKISDGKGGELIVFRNGVVRYPDGHEEVWEPDKVASFFDYVYANGKIGISGYDIVIATSGGTTTVGLPGSDPLIGQIGSGNPGNDLGDFFNTPSPTGSGGGGSDSGGDNGGGGGGGGNPATPPPPAPSWCKHWLLSYCADLFQPPANPTPTPTPTGEPGVIQAVNCSEWAAQTGYKTIISNSSCESQ
jgi:hypothetical protein